MNNNDLLNIISALQEHKHLDSGAIGSLIANFYKNFHLYGLHHKQTIFCISNLALKLVSLKLFEEAKPLYTYVGNLLSINNEDIDASSANISEIASILDRFNYYAEAELLYKIAINFYAKKYGDDHINVAILYNNIGSLCHSIGRFSDAEAYYRLSLSIKEKWYDEDDPSIAQTLNNLANACSDLGKLVEAEKLYLNSLEIRKRYCGEHSHEYAESIINLAAHYQQIGKHTGIEGYYFESIAIFNKCHGNNNEYSILAYLNLSYFYMKLGRFSEASSILDNIFSASNKIFGSNHTITARCLLAISKLKRNLGVNDKQYENNATEIFNNIFDSGHLPKSFFDNNELLYNKASELIKEKNYIQAKDIYNKLLNLETQNYGENSLNLTFPLNNLGSVNCMLGNYDEGLKYFRRALSLVISEYGLINIQTANFIDNIARCYRDKGNIDVAICLRKKSVNIWQKVRNNVSKIGSNELNSFDTSIRKIYIGLASMLLELGRLVEAEYVLSLLKEDEYFDFVRGENTHLHTVLPTISYNAYETILNKKFDVFSATMSNLFIRENELRKVKHLSDEEKSEIIEIRSRTVKISHDFEQFLDELHTEFGHEVASQVDDSTNMVATLWDLDEGTAVIYTLSTKDSFHTILVTRHFRTKFTSQISSKKLNEMVLRFRNLIMQRDKYDVEQLAFELYTIILAPMELELKDAGITTLLWMLEGELRLLPVSALNDGNDYIVTKYQNVYLTTKSRENLQAQSRPRWTALGLGVTKAHENFQALTSVKDELEGIVKSELTEGILQGEIFLDADFTWETMTNKLDGEYQAVHIASHFKLDPCNETMSYLLLGDGSHLTLDKLKTQKALFRGVDLLTFSACSTGVGTANKLGREIDGIGYIGETQGAKTVMATLWPVADESTSLLMKDFYRRRTSGLSKIEALRQSQLAMLNGTTKPTKSDVERSSDAPLRYEVDKDKPYAHPYYWAPFVLIGNYR